MPENDTAGSVSLFDCATESESQWLAEIRIQSAALARVRDDAQQVKLSAN